MRIYLLDKHIYIRNCFTTLVSLLCSAAAAEQGSGGGDDRERL